jgi:hypothetical protein
MTQALAREQPMSSPIGFREFGEDEYRKFIQTLSDEELISSLLKNLVFEVFSFSVLSFR